MSPTYYFDVTDIIFLIVGWQRSKSLLDLQNWHNQQEKIQRRSPTLLSKSMTFNSCRIFLWLMSIQTGCYQIHMKHQTRMQNGMDEFRQLYVSMDIRLRHVSMELWFGNVSMTIWFIPFELLHVNREQLWIQFKTSMNFNSDYNSKYNRNQFEIQFWFPFPRQHYFTDALCYYPMMPNRCNHKVTCFDAIRTGIFEQIIGFDDTPTTDCKMT